MQLCLSLCLFHFLCFCYSHVFCQDVNNQDQDRNEYGIYYEVHEEIASVYFCSLAFTNF